MEPRTLEPGRLEPRNPGTLELFRRASAIAADHDSGAAELTPRLLSLLADALSLGGDVAIEVARLVLAGHPAMAPLWQACAAAVVDRDQPGTFERTRAEMTRAREALVRAASLTLRDLFTDDPSPLVLTLSYSSSVARVLVGTTSSGLRLRVVCAEGRPRFEGRRLARELAQQGLEVIVVVDAALTSMLSDASAVVMGADAVTRDHWINKVGSFGLAAAASLSGVPVYVIAARDKFVPRALAPRLVPTLADGEEVWPDCPSGVLAQNRYFETIPADLATLFLTEAGPVAPRDVELATKRHAAAITSLLAELL